VIPAAKAPTADDAARPTRGRARADGAGKSLSLLPFPAWIRRRSEAIPEAHAAAFAAGAALAGLDAVVRAEPPWRGVWAQRLALRAAAACLSREGRRGEEAALRDAHALARPGDDPGPAGQVLRAWRRLVERPIRFDPEHLSAASEAFTLPTPRAALVRLHEALETGFSSDRPVVTAAAEAALATAELGPAAEFFGLWLADAVLAHQLGWVRPLPLLAAGLSDPALRGRFPERRPRPADPNWATACHLACAHAAARAYDLALELDRRAHVLLTVAPRLRAKQAPKIVAALLADDAVTASSRLAGMTDRSLRRLLERLVALGAARELTGRATSRLYGL